MHITDAFDEFLIFKRAQGRADRTIDDYRRCLERKFIPWCRDHDINTTEQLTRRAIWQYAAYLRRIPTWGTNIVGIYIQNLRTWLAWIHREGWTTKNLAQALETPRKRVSEQVPPSPEDVTRLIEACSGDSYALRDRALILTLASTGLRRKEIPNLTRSGLHLDDRWMQVYTSKTRRHRFAFLTPEAADALREYLNNREDDDDALFRSRYGGPLGYAGIYQMITKRAAAAGLDSSLVQTHQLRRFLATYWIRAGGDDQRLMHMMDWSTPEMIQIYARVANQADLQSAHDMFAPRLKV